MKIGLGATVKLFHLYLEGSLAPPMTSFICVFHLGISLGMTHSFVPTLLFLLDPQIGYGPVLSANRLNTPLVDFPHAQRASPRSLGRMYRGSHDHDVTNGTVASDHWAYTLAIA